MSIKCAVLGTGRFGSKLARELYYKGMDVLSVDIDPAALEQIKNEVTDIFEGDISDKFALLNSGVKDCDIVIVAQTQSIESNLIAVQLCLDFGIKKIICKAKNTVHGMILKKMGIEEIIFPEQDAAIKLANKISSKGVLDYFDLGNDLSIVALEAPQEWTGKSLQQLDLRSRHNITVATIHRGNENLVIPAWTTIIQKEDTVVVIGSEESLKKLNFDTSHRT
jgi:trk system potassium uptake protein